MTKANDCVVVDSATGRFFVESRTLGETTFAVTTPVLTRAKVMTFVEAQALAEKINDSRGEDAAPFVFTSTRAARHGLDVQDMMRRQSSRTPAMRGTA